LKKSPNPSRQFSAQFQKRDQLFIRVRNETLSVAAMRVSNPDCSPLSELMAET
jgi:hypothetical protein